MNTNRTVIVTAPTGGIGAPLCKHLAHKGYNLILLARNEDALKNLSAKLSSDFPDSTFGYFCMDFSNLSSIEKAMNAVGRMNTKVDGVVMMPPQVPPTSEALPESDVWLNIFQTSFIGPLQMLKRSIAYFNKSAKTKVVVVSGISSAQVLGHYATSNVLRLSWLAEAKTLAHALGPQGIHVNTLSLGGVMTEKYTQRILEKAKVAGLTFEDQMKNEVSNVPLQKYASPKEVAVAIEGLLSEFSDHMTGMNILCDGGFTRAY